MASIRTTLPAIAAGASFTAELGLLGPYALEDAGFVAAELVASAPIAAGGAGVGFAASIYWRRAGVLQNGGAAVATLTVTNAAVAQGVAQPFTLAALGDIDVDSTDTYEVSITPVGAGVAIPSGTAVELTIGAPPSETA